MEAGCEVSPDSESSYTWSSVTSLRLDVHLAPALPSPALSRMGREHAKRANDTSFQPPKRRPVRPARHLDVSLEERKKLEHRQQGAINLESRFCHLPAELAAYWRASLVTETFTRPLPPSAAQLLREQVDGSGAPLICPRRPKWHRDATKLHVESNEAALHKVWLRDLDAALAGNQEGGPGHDGSHEKEEWTYDATNGGDGQGEPMNGGDGQGEPTFVERNLEVWRQLWRVGEASDVLCALADCRFPLLHLPASLLSYLRTLKPARPVLLVLTKCDLVSEDVVEAWQAYYQRECPDFRILCVESYQDGDRGRTGAFATRSSGCRCHLLHSRRHYLFATRSLHRSGISDSSRPLHASSSSRRRPGQTRSLAASRVRRRRLVSIGRQSGIRSERRVHEQGEVER